MAAGKSSRYQSLKQIETIGPSNATLLEYNIYNAKSAGFRDVILIITKETECYFNKLKEQISNTLNIKFVFQDIEKHTNKTSLSYNRKKPWGTGQALLTCKDICKTPFVLINSDDFYGKSNFQNAMLFFKKGNESHLIIPYYLQNTLLEYGAANRGICKIKNNRLIDIKEKEKISRGSTKGENPLVSMNFWGFQPSIFEHIEKLFEKFLQSHKAHSDEFLLSNAINDIINNTEEIFTSVETKEKWMGLTYNKDKIHVHNELCKLNYPLKLWEK